MLQYAFPAPELELKTVNIFKIEFIFLSGQTCTQFSTWTSFRGRGRELTIVLDFLKEKDEINRSKHPCWWNGNTRLLVQMMMILWPFFQYTPLQMYICVRSAGSILSYLPLVEVNPLWDLGTRNFDPCKKISKQSLTTTSNVLRLDVFSCSRF